MTQNKLRVYLHFVWATYDRLPLITAEIERELYRYITKVCEDDGCDVLAIGGIDDHIHLFVSMSPTIAMSELMQHVKGGSSRYITKTLKTDGYFGWQGSYGAFSVSNRDRKMVTDYILNQKAHHAENSIWGSVEPSKHSMDAWAIPDKEE